jgi:hypothetical protein
VNVPSKYLLLAALGFGLTLFVFTHLPNDHVPGFIKQIGNDKVRHVLSYGIFSALLYAGLRQRNNGPRHHDSTVRQFNAPNIFRETRKTAPETGRDPRNDSTVQPFNDSTVSGLRSQVSSLRSQVSGLQSAVLIALVFAAVDELTQPLTGRTCSLLDYLASAGGAVAGAGLTATTFTWQKLKN